MKNPLWTGFEEWLAGVYHGEVMPPDQMHQIECAFFAGCAFSGRVRHEHGDEVVIEAIEEHLARKRAELAGR